MTYFFNVFLVCFVVVAVISDLYRHRIPNWLNLPAIALGVFFNAVMGVPQLVNSLFGFGLGLAIFFAPFALGWLGAGDVKFLAAVGAILGVQWVPRVVFYTALLGIPIALISVASRGFNTKVFGETLREIKLFLISRGAVFPPTIAERVSRGAGVVPYGVAIGLATLIAYYFDPRGQWMGF